MSANGGPGPQIVFSFPKSRDEEVRASLGTFRGQLRADLRVWVADEKDELYPTKKGISVPVDDLPKLQAAVDALGLAAKEAR